MLRAALPAHLRGAIAAKRQGLRTTLRLCVRTFDQVLASPDVPGGLRAAVRAYRGLCLAGQPVFVGHHPLVLAHGLVDERDLFSEESQCPSGHSRCLHLIAT